jgi:hypothetical protein
VTRAVQYLSVMKPSERFEQNIEPSFKEYVAEPKSQRRANILATSLSNQSVWTFEFYKPGDPQLFGATSLKGFREEIIKRCPELKLMWDLADADKHRFLTHPDPPRAVRVSTAAYNIKQGDGLIIAGPNQPFLTAAETAMRFWKRWQD